MRWNDAAKWIWSDQPVHEALIDTATFDQVQALRRARGARAQRAPRRTPRPYALRGILFCGACGRRMQGSWNNDAAYYRCMFLTQYAAKNKIDHPRTVYLREDQILPAVDRWLAGRLDARTLPQILRELEQANDPSATDPQHEQARRDIAACDAKLRQHRAALEAGADPKLVTGWMSEVQAQREAAEARLQHQPERRRMSPAELDQLVTSLRSLGQAVANANLADKIEIYGRLGLTLTYHPTGPERKVKAMVRPTQSMYVADKSVQRHLSHDHQCRPPARGRGGAGTAGREGARPMSAELVRCEHCGKRNRVPAAAQGVPQCGNCHQPLPWIATAGDDTFAEVAEAPGVPVLVDFWAPWCGPCRAVSPALERLASELASRLKLVKVNVDESPRLQERFAVQAIPTLLLLKNGQVADRMTGAAPQAALDNWVRSRLGGG